MFSFSSSLKIYLGVDPVDMRKSFNGLFAQVKGRLNRDPLDGAVYMFANRRRTLVKIIYWDGTGIWVLAKRLERGTYWWPSPGGGEPADLAIASESLAMILSGVDLKQGSLRPWYCR
jgi:transposase